MLTKMEGYLVVAGLFALAVVLTLIPRDALGFFLQFSAWVLLVMFVQNRYGATLLGWWNSLTGDKDGRTSKESESGSSTGGDSAPATDCSDSPSHQGAG